MARLSKLTSALSGGSPENRRVLAAVTAPTAAPATVEDGVLLPGPRHVWLTFAVSGTTPSADIILHCWDSVSQDWHELPGPEFQFTVTKNVRHRILLEGGPVRLLPQVTAISGTGATVSMWIAEAREEP